MIADVEIAPRYNQEYFNMVALFQLDTGALECESSHLK